MRTLPAAAVKAGDSIRLDEGEPLTISRVHNGEPTAGQIRWETTGSGDVTVSAALRVEVLALA